MSTSATTNPTVSEPPFSTSATTKLVNSKPPSYTSKDYDTEKKRQEVVTAVRASMRSMNEKLTSGRVRTFAEFGEERKSLNSILKGLDENQVRKNLMIYYGEDNKQSQPLFRGTMGEMESHMVWTGLKEEGVTTFAIFCQCDSPGKFDTLTLDQQFTRCVHKAFLMTKSIEYNELHGLTSAAKDELREILDSVEDPRAEEHGKPSKLRLLWRKITDKTRSSRAP